MEGRCLSEVAHLARLGVNLVRAGILGLLMEKSSEKSLLSLLYEGDQVFCGKKIRGRFLQKKVRSAILYRRETGDPRNCLEE